MSCVTDGPTIQDIKITRGAPYVLDGTVTFDPDSGSTLVGSALTFIVDPDLEDWWSGLPVTTGEALLTKTNASGMAIVDADHYTVTFDGSEFIDTSVFPYGDVRPYSINAAFGLGRPFELQRGFLYVEER